MILLAAISMWVTASYCQATDNPDATAANANAQGEALPEVTPAEAPLPRVIVYPSRLHAIAGHLVEESRDSVTVKDRRGQTHQFDPSLIFSVVRLHDVDEPVPAFVLLQDGRRREGLLEDDGFDVVRIRVHGVPHSFERDDVALVRLLPSFKERYQQLREKLDEDNPQAYLALCQWMIEEDHLEEAQAELEQLVKLHDSELGRRLLRRVRARLALKALPESTPATTTPAVKDAMPGLVTDSDVNLVRVYEIDLDNPPKMRVPATTVRKLFERYGTSDLLPNDNAGKAAFTKADPATIVEVMFALRARDLYGEIRVLGEPDVLRTFRTRIHDTWLLNTCGSRACHGGTEATAGRFRLHGTSRPNDRVRTSNLLALNRLELDGRRMLDWSSPENSLVYQYALPPAEARIPHPDVAGYKPAFAPGDSPTRRVWHDWITAMKGRHHRDWPVEYEPWTPPAPGEDHDGDGSDATPRKSR